ncbi:hypothetical protein NDU88_001847 [Pleurodeles waltl]|uniref:Uncharacterized protein n=1 Tax=Pleurodeles waltl TaxID=8319 RepID=A0AAV7W0P1_PLEWA|nr:hypothetical protein NDU88_001847 [Pleurodeles waltl]
MVKKKKRQPSQQMKKMEKDAVPRQTGGHVVLDNAKGAQEKDHGPSGEPSLGAIMAAIQDLRGSLEPKLDTVTVDVTLLRADLKKVTEKVINAETDIARLQSTSKRLEDQIQFLTAGHGKIVVHLQDQKGMAQRKNSRVGRVPEGVEGPSVELFLETLITDSLRPKRLSKFFTVKRAHVAPVQPP